MSKKKIFKVLGIILSIILVILILYLIVIHFNGFLNKDNSMTREETIKLLEKGKEYSNYYYSPKNKILFFNIEENKTEYYIKDNIIKCVNNDQLLSWTDYNNNEIISIWEKDNNKYYATVSSLENYNENNESQRGFDYSIISNKEVFNMDFEYMGEKTYEGRTTILVKVWNQDSLKINSTIFYIDKETGLIMRRIDYTALGFLKMDCNRNVKFDIVTDNDIQRPNLEEYDSDFLFHEEGK